MAIFKELQNLTGKIIAYGKNDGRRYFKKKDYLRNSAKRIIVFSVFAWFSCMQSSFIFCTKIRHKIINSPIKHSAKITKIVKKIQKIILLDVWSIQISSKYVQNSSKYIKKFWQDWFKSDSFFAETESAEFLFT